MGNNAEKNDSDLCIYKKTFLFDKAYYWDTSG